MTLFEWIITLGIVLVLLLLWYMQRRIGALLVQGINEVGAIRAAVEMVSRSYLGLESVWEAHDRTMGRFGGFVAMKTAEGLPIISSRRMGDVLIDISAELTKIRERLNIMSGLPPDDEEK